MTDLRSRPIVITSPSPAETPRLKSEYSPSSQHIDHRVVLGRGSNVVYQTKIGEHSSSLLGNWILEEQEILSGFFSWPKGSFASTLAAIPYQTSVMFLVKPEAIKWLQETARSEYGPDTAIQIIGDYSIDSVPELKIKLKSHVVSGDLFAKEEAFLERMSKERPDLIGHFAVTYVGGHDHAAGNTQ